MVEELGSNSSPPSEQPPTPLVAISILNWNGWRDTLECLAAIQRLDYPNYLTVVVDNGSWNDSVERTKAWARERLGPEQVLAEYARASALQGGDPEMETALGRVRSAQRLVLICNEENRGFAGGHNIAIRYALSRRQAADFIFLLNNDAVIPSDCLTRLIAVQRAANAGIVGPSVNVKDHPHLKGEGPFSIRESFFAPFVRARAPSETTGKPYYESDFVIGAAMLVRKDVLADIGSSAGEYLRSDLFYSGEEESFCFAAKQRDYSIVMTTDTVVDHLWGTSTGGKGSILMYYYGQRNPVLMARVMLPFRQRMLFYPLNLGIATGRIVKNLFRWRVKVAWAVLQGVLDGYRGRVGKWKYHDREVKESRSP
jgi:hypothetical protein